MDKVDTLLQEIYLEMEIEELQEELNLLSERGLRPGNVDTSKLNALIGKATELAKKAKEATGPAREAAMKQLQALKGQIADLKSAAAKAGAGAIEKGQQVAGDAAKGAKELGSKVAGSDAGKAVGKVAGQAKELVTQNPEAAAAAAAIATVAAGVAVYKKFFSQAARACKGKSGSDKKSCVAAFKVKGLQAAKSKVSAGMSKCKDPKCKAKLQKKVQGFDAKIQSMKGGMAEDVINSYVGDYLAEEFEQDSKN